MEWRKPGRACQAKGASLSDMALSSLAFVRTEGQTAGYATSTNAASTRNGAPDTIRTC